MNNINTRIESKSNFSKLRENYFNNKPKNNISKIKPINNKSNNFELFAKKDNSESYDNFIKKYKTDPNSTLYLKNNEINKNNKIKENFNYQTKLRVNANSKNTEIPESFNYQNIIKKENYNNNISKNIENFQNELTKKPNLNKVSKNKIEYFIKKYTNNDYTPEIGFKNKLINIIKIALKKRNITADDNIINQLFSRYNLSFNKPDPEILKQIIYELKESSYKKNISNVLFEKETIRTDYLISINSSDRNINKYSKPSEFSIDFSPKADNNQDLKGFINRSFNNVIEVQLISCIFPKNNLNGDNLEEFPYILLEINQLGSNYSGTNDHISKAFAQLTFDIDMGKYKKIIINNNYQYIKKFHPRISLDKFNIKFKKPDGELFNFGDNDEDLEFNKANIHNNTNTNNGYSLEYSPNPDYSYKDFSDNQNIKTQMFVIK